LGDWLGTGTIAPQLREYLPFKEAREFVHGLGLKGEAEWRKYCKGELPEKGSKPEDIPANPDKIYKNKGWIGYGNWLGTGNVATRLRPYRSFKQAREFVHGLGLKGKEEWGKYSKGDLPEKGMRSEDIPANPGGTYKNKGWVNWGDWLGTGTIAPQLREFLPFKEAREFVHGLELKNFSEWPKYRKGDLPEKGVRPKDIPTRPDQVYKTQGWSDWGDWLGTAKTKKKRKS